MKKIESIWYGHSPWQYILLPLSGLFLLLSTLKRWIYLFGLVKPQQISIPIIVVGNISVGGTGKTPLVAWMADHLRSLGYKPAIISRGYGGKAKKWPQQVRSDSDPEMVGDETVLLARRCQCPVAAAPQRINAARALLKHTDCDIIISDDGLQHYDMHRDLEIVVVDGVRRFGNGYCLPAGPLREPVSRLNSVDLVVINGQAGGGEFSMRLNGTRLIRLDKPDIAQPLHALAGCRVHGVAGIGNPKRFFDQLRASGLEVIEHPLPDHHSFEASDIQFADDLLVIMTEKDAVKCQHFANERHWVLPVSAELDDVFVHRFNLLLKRIDNG